MRAAVPAIEVVALEKFVTRSICEFKKRSALRMVVAALDKMLSFARAVVAVVQAFVAVLSGDHLSVMDGVVDGCANVHGVHV